MKRLLALWIVAAVACRQHEAPAPQAAKKAARKAAAVQGVEVGNTMPAYATTLLDGTPFQLAAQKGNVVFVNVWATWCGPCRMEIPELAKLDAKYHGRGLRVVGVSIEESSIDDVKKFVRDEKVAYPIAFDNEGTIANLLQTTVLPTSVIIDRNGKIVWKQVGAIVDNDVPEVERVIEKALGGP